MSASRDESKIQFDRIRSAAAASNRRLAREQMRYRPFEIRATPLSWGTLEGKRVAFLARHARGHRFLPTEINYRANVYAMKLLGVERIISVSAVGSLQENLHPLEFLIPDQFYDRTRHGSPRSSAMASSLMWDLTNRTARCSREFSAPLATPPGAVHRGGTYICMEGPQFSTLAESHVYRQLRFEVIGMTNLTEAKLAREAEICYATVAMITDYDCWHPEHASVTLEDIITNLNKNAENVQNVIRDAVRTLPGARLQVRTRPRPRASSP